MDSVPHSRIINSYEKLNLKGDDALIRRYS